MIGISGRRFLTVGAIVLVALFVIGVVIDPNAALSGSAVLAFAWIALAKVGVWLVLSALFIGATFYYIYDTPLTETLGAIVGSGNPVYAISAGTLALLVFLVVFGAAGDGFRDYLHQVLMKGSFSLFVGGLITVLIARFWRLGSLDAFKEGLTERHNLNYSLVIAVILICVTGLIATT